MRDKFLTEAMGECWHEPKSKGLNVHNVSFGGTPLCKHCGCHMDWLNTPMPSGQLSFSTWEGFGKLWEWAQEQEWWGDFFLEHSISMYHPHKAWGVSRSKHLINPDNFADAVYEFLKERND